ncbi:MAG: hypothetical protein IBX43_09605, partial [Campylobacterales bacterium]|nr:hypothetical protein [Campylobacterales bacterium]
SKIKFDNHFIKTKNRKLHYDRAIKTMETLEKSYSELHTNYALIRGGLAKAIIGR